MKTTVEQRIAKHHKVSESKVEIRSWEDDADKDSLDKFYDSVYVNGEYVGLVKSGRYYKENC